MLNRYLMPFMEKRSHVFRNLLPVKSFYKGEVLGVLNAIFQSGHGDDDFVFRVVDSKQMRFNLMNNLILLFS